MDNELIQATASSRGIIKYVIRDRDSRLLLAAHMKQTVTRAFDKIPRDCNRLWDELLYLDEAITFLTKENPHALLVRNEAIQKCLYAFFEIMEDIRSYSTQPQSNFKERKLSKTLKRFIDQLNNQTNLRLSHHESLALAGIEQILKQSLFRLSLKRIAPEFHSIFEGRYYKPAASSTKDQTVQQLRLALLNQFSPELVFAYREADSLLDEAEELAVTPEDEYLIEQVTQDYYPHIFEALKSVTNEKTSFSQKESVVTESLKQFNIIQLGLHKIIDKTIVRNLNAMKTQTDFLRNKVLGSESLSLNPNELELVVDNSVEQAQKLREELYMKHVAPHLEQSRQEYEDRIANLQTEHAAELKVLAVQNWQYKSQITGLEAQIAYRNGLQTNFQ